MLALRLCTAPWAAAWPDDREALARALAVAAAFPSLVGALRIELAGNPEAALAGLVGELGAVGVSVDDLPAAQLVPTQAPSDAPHVVGLPAALAASCEYERRPWVSVFGDDDLRHCAVWVAAAAALAVRPEATVTVIAETLDAIDAVAGACDRVHVVAGDPSLRRAARRIGVAAVPRPPHGRHLPAAGVVVIDGRRPDDLALACGAGVPVSTVNGERLNGLAVAAFDGVDVRPFERLPVAA